MINWASVDERLVLHAPTLVSAVSDSIARREITKSHGRKAFRRRNDGEGYGSRRQRTLRRCCRKALHGGQAHKKSCCRGGSCLRPDSLQHRHNRYLPSTQRPERAARVQSTRWLRALKLSCIGNLIGTSQNSLSNFLDTNASGDGRAGRSVGFQPAGKPQAYNAVAS